MISFNFFFMQKVNNFRMVWPKKKQFCSNITWKHA